jgi:uncharacterized protein YjbJ (UPF0337 family)
VVEYLKVFRHVGFFVFGVAGQPQRPRVGLGQSQQPLGKGVTVMGGKTDEVKGRIKEAAGALTGNDKLREEGKTDQAVGKAEQAVQNAADTVKEAVKKVID